MILANYNIQEFVTDQINTYLTDNELSFSDLKTLLLSKSPIPNVHSNIVTILAQAKHSDQVEVQKALEKQAHKKQLAEDAQQQKQDRLAALKDEELKDRFTRELNHIPTQLSSYGTESALLQLQLTRVLEMTLNVEVIHHHEHDLKKPATTLDEPRHTIERLRKSILNYGIKTQALLEKKQSMQKSLQEIELRARESLTRQLERSVREQARIGYNSSGEGVLETLSTQNQSQLSKSIYDQHKALEKKCTDLIMETEQINYIFFIEQLRDHLTHSSLSSSKVEALNTILKLMKQHVQYEQQSATSQDSLNKKIQSISSQINKLQELNNKLHALREDNPNLTSANQQLSTRNTDLALSLEHNSSLQQRLGAPTLLLFALTFIFTIPLILTITGIIPFFIAPALLFTLVATPPALLLIAALVTGISAAVYAYKAHSDESEIKMNKQTIENNNDQMGRNTQHLHTLQAVTIPNLETQIKKDELTRDLLVDSLKKTQLLAKQILKKANEIDPVLYSSIPFLSNSKNGYQEVSADTELSVSAVGDIQESSGLTR